MAIRYLGALSSQGGATAITMTGGTGRFVGVSGGFIPVAGPATVNVDPATMTMTMTYTYTAKGTITY